MSQIIKNSITTPDGTELISRHRHDFVSHVDKNGGEYYIDGGNEYLRRGFPADKESYKENSVYLEDVSLDEAANIATWGTYGKNGKGPLKYKPISSLETEHLEIILDKCNPVGYLREIMEWELGKRTYEKKEEEIESYEE